MPIYEFYCPDCHAIFNFFARRPDTRKRPACPRCGRPKLDRRFSRFAISKGRSESASEEDEGPLGELDAAKMERLLSEMATEAEGMDEDDPRQMARMMRKLYEGAGLRPGGAIEEAMRRMEAGEDPDQIEEEMGDLLEAEDPFFAQSGSGLRGLSQKLRPPEVDETLYDL